MEIITIINICLTLFCMGIITKTLNNYYHFFYLLKYNRKIIGRKMNIDLFNKYPNIRNILIYYIFIPFIKFIYFVLSYSIYFLYAISENEIGDIENLFIDKEFHKDEITTIIDIFNENELLLSKNLITQKQNNLNHSVMSEQPEIVEDLIEDYMLTNKDDNSTQIILESENIKNQKKECVELITDVDNIISSEDDLSYFVNKNINTMHTDILETGNESIIKTEITSKQENPEEVEIISIDDIDFNNFIINNISQMKESTVKQDNMVDKKIIKIGKKKKI